jgi:DNA anti-recombination protein RmuC
MSASFLLLRCVLVQAAADKKKEELLQALAVLAPAIQVHAIIDNKRQSAEIKQTIHNAAQEIHNAAREAEDQREEMLDQQTKGFAAIAKQGRKNLEEMAAQNEQVLKDVNNGFDKTRKQIAEASQRTMAQLLETHQQITVGFDENGKFHQKTHVDLDKLSKDQQMYFGIMMSTLVYLMPHGRAQSREEDVRL